jgi:hypothetical protein
VSLVVIDSRYREKECADLARKMGSHLVKLSKGSAFKGNQLFTVKKLDRHPITGEVLKDGLIELGSNTNLLKGRLSHAIAKASDGDEGALQIYEDIDPTYIGEMTAEELVVVRDSGGRAIGERWEKREGRRANHYWDTEVLNFLAAAVLMIDQVRAQQLRERDRQAREEVQHLGVPVVVRPTAFPLLPPLADRTAPGVPHHHQFLGGHLADVRRVDVLVDLQRALVAVGCLRDRVRQAALQQVRVAAELDQSVLQDLAGDRVPVQLLHREQLVALERRAL